MKQPFEITAKVKIKPFIHLFILSNHIVNDNNSINSRGLGGKRNNPTYFDKKKYSPMLNIDLQKCHISFQNA